MESGILMKLVDIKDVIQGEATVKAWDVGGHLMKAVIFLFIQDLMQRGNPLLK